MHHKRAHLVIPDDLLTDVDALVGPRGRSAFITEVIREAVNRRRLLAILGSTEAVLKDADYPEFRDGSEAWVRRLREEDLQIEQEKLADRA
jgi:metal-responsive CopG/Arc/MetJ family transcriptional regulator